MTRERRAQLIEDIERSAAMRKRIAEQARSDQEFDIAAAFKEVADLDTSIANRLITSLGAKS